MTAPEKEELRKQHALRKERKAAKKASKKTTTTTTATQQDTTTTTEKTKKTKKEKKDKKEKKSKKEKKEKKSKDKKEKKEKKKKKSKEPRKQDDEDVEMTNVPAIVPVVDADNTTTTTNGTSNPKKRKSSADKSEKKKKKSKRARTESTHEQMTSATTAAAAATTTTTAAAPLQQSTSKFMDGYTDAYLMGLKKTNPAKLKEIRKARQKAKKLLHSKTTALENVANHKAIQAAATAVKEARKQKWEEQQAVKRAEEEKLWRDKPTKVFVGGLPYGVSERKLQVFFKTCGPFAHVDMPVFEDSGRSMGVAHIDFVTAKGAAQCVAMNEVTWCGRWLKIVFHDQMSREDGRYEQMRYGFGGNNAESEGRREKVRPEQETNPGPCPEGCTRLWIGGLPYDATKEEIVSAFVASGVVLSVNISTDKETNESKGFGHVIFETEEECQQAMETAALNKGIVVGTQLCRIDYATQRRWEKPRAEVGGGGNQGESSSGGASGEGTEVHWKKAPTRSRNRGAVEDFQGAKVTFGGSDSDDSSDSD